MAVASPNEESPEISNFTKWGTVAVLCLINLINYMDRYTIIGVLSAIMAQFEIEETNAALLNTVFLLSYIILCPVAGYLGNQLIKSTKIEIFKGDRYNRKLIILFGLLFWSSVVLVSSFISGKDHFYLFLSTRALVGIGEATYSCIAPTSNITTTKIIILYFI